MSFKICGKLSSILNCSSQSGLQGVSSILISFIISSYFINRPRKLLPSTILLDQWSFDIVIEKFRTLNLNFTKTFMKKMHFSHQMKHSKQS